MFTQIINGKRRCKSTTDILIASWDYIKEVLKEAGFIEVQTASPSEYIMKGCNNKVLVYVKYTGDADSTLVFLKDKDKSDQLRLSWTNQDSYTQNGNVVLDKVRDIWRK